MAGERANIVDSDIAMRRYMLIHKLPVGPKTADDLVAIAGELSKRQSMISMEAAGWAFAEACMVGNDHSEIDRLMMAQGADDCWTYALEIAQHAAGEKAWERQSIPNFCECYRLESLQAYLPIFRSFAKGRVSYGAVKETYLQLSDLAATMSADIELAKKFGYMKDGHLAGIEANLRGHLSEVLCQLAVFRLGSTRTIPLPSSTRSDNGSIYPNQTHDFLVLNLEGDKIKDYQRFEVKQRLGKNLSQKYTASGIIGIENILSEAGLNLKEAVDLLAAEAQGNLDPTYTEMLDAITNEVIHVLRHRSNPQRNGEQCLPRYVCDVRTERPYRRRVA